MSARILLLSFVLATLPSGLKADSVDPDSLYAIWSDTTLDKASRVDAYYKRFSVIQNEFAGKEVERWMSGVKTAQAWAAELGKTSYLSRFLMVETGLVFMTSESPQHSCSLAQETLSLALKNQDYHSALIASFLSVFADCQNLEDGQSNASVISRIPSILDSIDRHHSSVITRKQAYLITADFFYSINMDPEALRYYQKGFQLSPPSIESNFESISLENLGVLLMENGSFEEAKVYFRIGLKQGKEMNDKLQIGVFYVNLAQTAINQGNSQEARRMLDSAAMIMQGEEKCYACMMKTRRIRAGIDNLEGHHQAALDQLLELKSFYESSHSSNPGRTKSKQAYYIELGRAYLGLNQPEKAMEAARAAKQLALTNRPEIQEIIYRSWESMGDYQQAFSQYQRFIQLQDSINTLRNSAEVTRIQLEHRFSQKQLADSLSTAKRQLEQELAFQAQLGKQKTTQNLWLGLGILASIIAITVYSRLRFVKRTEAALKEKNKLIEAEKENAQASERAKQQFLANMSHEIRTPMNAIKGMTDILLRKDPQSEQLSYLTAIKESSNSLLVIINDILDLSKIEAGKVELEEIPFSMAEVVGNIQTIMQFKAEEKGLELHTSPPDNLPDRVIGDPTRLHQILLNLVSNAIKFTEKGMVSIRMKSKQKGDQLRVEFCVSDTGIGIGDDRIEKIFQSFEQAYSDTTRKFGGTGLGLSITKKLVEVQEGTIRVESEKGKGSQFYVNLSYPIASKKTVDQKITHEASDLASRLKGIRILLVEDNTFNAIVAQEELADSISDTQIEVAENGAIALEKMKTRDFDLVLMDVQMPVMNGYETTQKIRTLPPEKSTIPIIAMTANVMKEEVDRCFEAGMDDFIGKPFDLDTLHEKMYRLLNPVS